MKRFLVITLAIVMCVVLFAGCGGKTGGGTTGGGGGGGDDKIFVGALYDSLQVESRVNQRNALEKYAPEMGIRLEFQDGRLSEQVQIEQAENLISQGVDAIILMAHNAEAMGPLVDMCNENGVILLVTDRIVPDQKYDYYVGFDDRWVGDWQAQFAVDNAPKGNYALIAGAPTDPNVIIWEDGWDRVLTPYVESGDINIVFRDRTKDWDTTIAANNMENALTLANDDIQAVLAMADILATGVVQVLDQRGLAGKVIVTGLDGESTAYQRIAEGTQHMTIQVPDVEISRAMLQLLVDHFAGKDLSGLDTLDNGTYKIPAIFVEFQIVDASNLMEMIKLGYADYDFTFENVPEADRPPRP